MIEVVGETKYVRGEMFRLVHNNKKVLTLIVGSKKTVTSTNHEVKEFKTRQEALDWIGKSKLEYDLPEIGVDYA